MSDYISREAVMEALLEWAIMHETEDTSELDEMITRIPSADVRPVVRGKWEICDWVEYDGHEECIHYPKEGLRCTKCRNAFKASALWKDNFCPNCGADMREEHNEP